MMGAVLDASALLALLNREPGSEQVANVVAGAAISTVNLEEVVAKLSELGMPEGLIHEVLDLLGLEVIAFDGEQAYQSGLLRALTWRAGLSFGDRACLALARILDLPALTADRAWQVVDVGVTVQVIR